MTVPPPVVRHNPAHKRARARLFALAGRARLARRRWKVCAALHRQAQAALVDAWIAVEAGHGDVNEWISRGDAVHVWSERVAVYRHLAAAAQIAANRAWDTYAGTPLRYVTDEV